MCLCSIRVMQIHFHFSVDLSEIIAHSEFDIDSNGVVSEEEAKVCLFS